MNSQLMLMLVWVVVLIVLSVLKRYGETLKYKGLFQPHIPRYVLMPDNTIHHLTKANLI